MDLKGLIQAAKEACHARSEAELARCLGVTRGALNNWKTGQRFPDWDACARLAKATGLDLATVLQIVAQERSPGGTEEPSDDQRTLPGFELASVA
jgi:transcriptional regulator with XRE-family HTH domain